MGEELNDIVGQMRTVIATTTEVDKLSENTRNVFTHEMKVRAPDENERVGLLEGIVDERRVRLGKEDDLGNIAVKTATSVAGYLVNMVEDAVVASQDCILRLRRNPALAKDILIPPRARLSGGLGDGQRRRSHQCSKMRLRSSC